MSGSHFNKPKFATQQRRTDSRNNTDLWTIPVIEWTAAGTPNSHSTASIPSSLHFYTSSQGRERNEFSLPNLTQKKERGKERGRGVSKWGSVNVMLHLSLNISFLFPSCISLAPIPCRWRPFLLPATKGTDKSWKALSLWYTALWCG